MLSAGSGREGTGPGDRRRSREGGFSLAEVMVSVTVLVVGVLGLFSSLTTASKLEQSTQRYSARVRVVNDALERLRNGSLVTRAQEFVAQPAFTEDGQTVTVRFAAATLTHDLPKYSSTTSPFLDVNQDGYLDVVSANAAAPGILPVRITITTGADPIVLEALIANR